MKTATATTTRTPTEPISTTLKTGTFIYWVRDALAPPPGAHHRNRTPEPVEDITYPIAQPIAQSITEAVARFDRLTALTDQALAEAHLVSPKT